MNRISYGLLTFVAVFLILLGAIFLIAGGMENMVTGVMLIVVAAMIFLFLYRSDRIESSRPTVVNQTFNVKMEGSGTMERRELKCRTCGAPLTDKDLKVVQGGVMMTCPYCGSVIQMEEAPKW